jgi:hypothetical protein
MSRAYQPAEGGERAFNSHPAYVDGEMPAVTKIAANAHLATVQFVSFLCPDDLWDLV